MAYEENIHTISLKAPSTAFSTKQYYAVMASSSEGYLKLATSNSTALPKAITGVLQDAPTVAGEACKIATYGSITKIRSGSTQLKPGDSYRITNAGIARLASSGATAREVFYGPWLSPAASTAAIGTAMINVIGITT